MGIKFIHFSDSHLGFSDLDLLDGNGSNIREEDVYTSFASIVDYILEEKPDFVIHSGDIFHRSSPQNKTLINAIKQIQRITSAGIPLYLIAGNHDYPKSVFTTPIHELYSAIPECNIFFNEKYEVIEKEKYIIHALPHINSESKYQAEVSRIKVSDRSKPNILIMHVSMPSFLMNEYGERVFPNESIPVLKEFDYVALGHWHRFKHLSKYGNVFYSGSTEVFSDREMGYDKGLVKVVIDSKTRVEFVSIATRFYKTIKVNECSSKEKDNIIKEIRDKLKDIIIAGGIFTIQLLELSPLQVFEISKTDLNEIFKGALYFNMSKTVKGSNEKFEYDSESFNLNEQLNEDLKENFKEKEEYIKVFKLTQNLLNEIEEEEANAD